MSLPPAAFPGQPAAPVPWNNGAGAQPTTSTRGGQLQRALRGPLPLDIAAFLVLLACTLVLHLPGLLGQPTYYEQDTQLFYYPLANWVGEQLRQGAYPLWTPAIFAGYPIYADGELGLLYLPQVLCLWLLPTPIALVALRALHVFAAGAFMHLFLRRSTRVRPIPALGGALVFAFGSFLSVQMHHENVVRSAVWLPLILLLADQALRPNPARRRLGWTALGALAFAQSALGLHVQPVMMIALALGLFALFRILAGHAGDPALERTRPTVGLVLRGAGHRLLWGILVPAGVVGGGLLLASAQWLPLAEWALVSFRRSGVTYEFASAFTLTWQNLITVLFPYFFRLPDAGTWWMIWQSWETLLYVGIPTLALVLLGAAFSWRREAIYFLVLGVLSLLIGLSLYAPLVNLHQLLWELPGFSFLRAPGRFTYLIVFAAGGLAALGLQALADRRARANRLAVAMTGIVPPAVTLVALLITMPVLRSWLAADPERGRAVLSATYLDVRAQYIMQPAQVYSGMLASLDLLNPKTAWSLGLLLLTVLGLTVWYLFGRRRVAVAQAVLVGLIAADLLVFATDFHPRTVLADLSLPTPPGVPVGARVDVRESGELPELQPNGPLAAGLASIDGYSSLPSQRQVELLQATQREPSLQVIWSAPYVIEPKAPADGRQAGGVFFRTVYPLAAGYAATGSTRFDISGTMDGGTSALRVISDASYAFQVPQGTAVANIVVTDRQGTQVTLPLRAGQETAERAIDRPSLQGLLQHQKPPNSVAYSFPEFADGEDYQAHLYLAELPLPQPMDVASIEVRPVHDTALIQVYGIGMLPAAGGAVRSLSIADRGGFQQVGETDRYVVLQDSTALPRAHVRPRDGAVYRVGRPSTTLAEVMGGSTFDPSTNFLLEWAEGGLGFGGPQLAGETLYTQGDELWRVQTWRDSVSGQTWDVYDKVGSATEQPTTVLPATVEDLGPNAIRITAHADVPSYLIVDDFYHRGWNAWVDGQPAQVHIANALFRAVTLDPGDHVVEMRFQPLSHIVGAGLSLFGLFIAVLFLLFGFTRLPLPRVRLPRLRPRQSAAV